MRVELNSEELYPYYEIWHGFGKPDFDVEVPDDLLDKYTEAKDQFMAVLSELRNFLKDE